MNYYELQSVATAPFIAWKLVAESEAEYLSLGLDTNPLVVTEANLPTFVNGIADKKIENGELVNATSEELATAATANSEVITTQDAANAEALRQYIGYESELADFSATKLHHTKTVNIGGNKTITLDGLPVGFWCGVRMTDTGTVSFSAPNGAIKGKTSITTIDEEVFVQHLGNEDYLIR